MALTHRWKALFAVAVLGLSACGGDPTPTSSPVAPVETPAVPTAAEETPGAPEVTPTEMEPSDDTVQIAYIHRLPDLPSMTLVDDIVARWNAQRPDIQVTATKWEGAAAELGAQLQTDVREGVGPCLAQTGYSEVPELFVKDVLLDVTDEAEQYKENYGGAYGQMTLAGITVGLPQDSGPLVYVYNAAELEALGLAVPTTLAELSAAAKTSAASGKYLAAFTPDEAAHWLSAQSAAAGGVWYSAEKEKWKVEADSAESKIVADFWQDLLDSGAAVTVNRFSPEFDTALTSGQLIGHIAAGWEVGFMLDVLDGTAFEGQWRVAQLPDFGAGAMTGPDGGSGVSVIKGCEHPAEAMEFNNWLNTQVDDLTTQGLVTAATQQPAQPEKWTRQFGGQDVMGELARANAALNPAFFYAPGWSALIEPMTAAADAAAAGTGQVAAVFSAAQSASLAALIEANLPVVEEE